jgi:hypothetical protein
MFSQPTDDRLSAWLDLRQQVESSDSPLGLVCDFWSHAPFTHYNKNIDQFNQKSWPTPWEIISDNIYDDFTIALMLAYSVKYTDRFKNSHIEIRSFTNSEKTKLFNLVYIDDSIVLNYIKSAPVPIDTVPDTLLLDNLMVIESKYK